MVTSITRATAGTRARCNFCSQSTAGDKIRARVMANARGTRISRAKYSTEITAIRIAAVLMAEEPEGRSGLFIGRKWVSAGRTV